MKYSCRNCDDNDDESLKNNSNKHENTSAQKGSHFNLAENPNI